MQFYASLVGLGYSRIKRIPQRARCSPLLARQINAPWIKLAAVQGVCRWPHLLVEKYENIDYYKLYKSILIVCLCQLKNMKILIIISCTKVF